MKAAALLSRLFLIVVALTLLMPSLAQAYTNGYTYFENVYVGDGSNFKFIWENSYGSYSIRGSVMPSWHGESTNDGGGALGTIALGVNKNETNSSVLKQALYDLLYKANTNQLHDAGTRAGQWERMGSSVVVHTMLGEKFSDSGRNKNRTISATDWKELKTRLVDNDGITMSKQFYDGTVNTTGLTVGPWYSDDSLETFDAARYTYNLGEEGNVFSWVFRDASGKIVYVLQIICANPLGALEGLPVYIPYDLSPSASLSKTVAEPDDSVDVTNMVENGSNAKSGEAEWRLTQMIFQPGTSLSSNDKKARDSDNDPCAAFTSGGRTSCTTVQKKDSQVFAANSTKVFSPKFTYDIPLSTPVGTRICFTASVSPPSLNPAQAWRHSSLECVIVSKKPKMQVWGGDVRAGGAIDTSTSTFNSLGRTYGSWGEYGVFSGAAGPLMNQGTNRGFASGAGLNRGSPDSSQAKWSDLTFANISNGSCTFGCYGFSPYAPSLAGQFTSSPSDPLLTGNRNLSSVGGNSYRATNLTITGGAIGAGKTIIIVASGTVTITGDISYSDGPYTSVSDIPQVVIKAAVCRT